MNDRAGTTYSPLGWVVIIVGLIAAQALALYLMGRVPICT
jgi:hypothetical protein